MDEHALSTLEFNTILTILAEETACSLGRELALALRPTTDYKVAERTQKETAEALHLMMRKGNIPLGGVTDIRPHLQRATVGGLLDPVDLLDIANTAESGRQLKAFLQKAGPEMVPSLVPYSDRIGQFPELENAIRRAIAPGGQLLDSASPDLARIRSRKRSTEARLIDRLNAYLSGSQRTMLQDPVIVQRGDRSCLAVKAEHRSSFGGIVHDTSASGATLFIEPAPVVEIGNEVRELDAAERREVVRILAELSDRVAKVAGALSTTVSAIASIDFIAARARLASKHRAVQPSWNRSGVVRLRSARHPLIDPEKVIAIDVALGESDNQILLITGPNTGGKTATLKTVGLCTLMAQAGLHIPATSAEMNCFAQVWADIGDEQSIQQSLSTFSGHITTIGRFIAGLAPNALVLLDEVGAGTDPAEGAALAQALLEHFRTHGARVVATSHYGELKSYAFVTPGVQNASVEFNEATLQPTYRVIQGVPGSSNAHAIASKLGIPPDIIVNARGNLVSNDQSVEIVAELETARRRVLAELSRAETARVEAEQLRSRAELELAKFEKTRREIREQVVGEARTVIKKAQDQAGSLLREIREQKELALAEAARRLIGDIETDVVLDIDRVLDLPEEPRIAELIEAPDQRPMRTGDRVRVTALGLVGSLLEDVDNKDKVAVQVGSLRLSVEPESLRLLQQERYTPRTVVRTRFIGTSGSEAATAISPQLNLLGQRADEAAESLERYLNDANAAGLDRVRIVHGKGSGVLRRVVQEHLRSSELVDEYAIAEADEGGAGATVAKLKV